MLIGYARTSTTEQEAGLQAQKRDLKSAGVEKIFEEQLSATRRDRPMLVQALDFVREGDTLVIAKLDRLARSTSHLLEVVEHLNTKQVALRILDFGGSEVDTRSPQGRLILTMFAAFAEFERDLMLERQREGIAKAKRDGKYKGRKPTALAYAKKAQRLREEGLSASAIAHELGISRASVYRIVDTTS